MMPPMLIVSSSSHTMNGHPRSMRRPQMHAVYYHQAKSTRSFWQKLLVPFFVPNAQSREQRENAKHCRALGSDSVLAKNSTN